MPPSMHADQVAATERGCIVQIQGDGNTVVAGLPHLRLTHYRTRRTVQSGDPRGAGFTPSGEREADLLRAYTGAIPFVGRGPERARLDAWLDGPAPVSVRVLTGRGGRGKTRLALEMCQARAAAGWRAGFIAGREMDRFRAQANLAEWGWNAPALIVLDYAAAFTVPLRAWLAELADNEARLGGGPPLRLLLLERHAFPDEGWWAEAFGRGGGEADAIAGLLDGPGADTMEAVRDVAERRLIFAAAYRRAAQREPDMSSSLDERLAKLSWGGEPLFLTMAGLLAARMGIGPAFALQPDELAFDQARRELERVRTIWVGHGLPRVSTELGTHLTALATLRGGLPGGERARLAIRAEREAIGYEKAGDPEPILVALRNAVPGVGGGIAPIEPDPLGGAVILERWGKLPIEDQVAAVLRAYRDAPGAVAGVLVRICQDFAIRGRREAINWLGAVCDAVGEEPDHIRILLTLMPEATVELREIAVGLTQAWLRHARGESEGERDDLAGMLDRLSVYFSALNRGEEALTASEEATRLYRELAAARPDAFTPGLALALSNRSKPLCDLGRWEQALDAVDEAIRLYRELAAARPDAFTAGLALALSNRSNPLSALDRWEEALDAVDEATRLYRELAAARPSAFTPDLALALGNRSNPLSALDRWEEALAASEEATRLYRELAAARPDAFTRDLALALGNLSRSLSDLDRWKEALAASQEAIRLYQELAAARPDAFTRDLALALSNLSRPLSALDRWEEALAASEEATRLYRELAAARPGASAPYRG